MWTQFRQFNKMCHQVTVARHNSSLHCLSQYVISRNVVLTFYLRYLDVLVAFLLKPPPNTSQGLCCKYPHYVNIRHQKIYSKNISFSHYIYDIPSISLKLLCSSHLYGMPDISIAPSCRAPITAP